MGKLGGFRVSGGSGGIAEHVYGFFLRLFVISCLGEGGTGGNNFANEVDVETSCSSLFFDGGVHLVEGNQVLECVGSSLGFQHDKRSEVGASTRNGGKFSLLNDKFDGRRPEGVVEGNDSAGLTHAGQVGEGPLLAVFGVDSHEFVESAFAFNLGHKVKSLVTLRKLVDDIIHLSPRFPNVGAAFLGGVSSSEELVVWHSLHSSLENFPKSVHARRGLRFEFVLVRVCGGNEFGSVAGLFSARNKSGVVDFLGLSSSHWIVFEF